MKRSLALLVVIVAGSTCWIASSRAEPAAAPTPAQPIGPWQVIAIPAGGASTGSGQAILLNSATGETWCSNNQASGWSKMSR